MTKIHCIQNGITPLFRNINKSGIKLTANRTTLASGVYGNHGMDTFLSSKPYSPQKGPLGFDVAQLLSAYLMSKRLGTNITQAEFAALEKYDGKEFDNRACDLLLNKMNIPPEIRPQVMYTDEISAAAMTYNFCTNQIFINSKVALPDKLSTLCSMRHELQHFAQNMLMLRHETVGRDLIRYFVHSAKENARSNIDEMVKTFSLNEIQRSIGDPAAVFHILGLKNLLQCNRVSEYERARDVLIETQVPLLEEPYKNLRNTVIEKLGALKEGSPEAKRAEKFYKETTRSESYWQENGKDIDYGKYVTDCRENEAFIAQDVLRFTLTGVKCYVKEWKKGVEHLIKGNYNIKEKLTSDVIQELERREKQNGNWQKEYLSYIYN